jgi:hypothetical protein
MPLRSVLDIEVNDNSFRDHVARFESYREATKEERDAWAKDQADRRRAERGEIAQEREQQRNERERQRELEKQGTIYDKIGRSWKVMREESSTVARNVRDIGSRLLHMTTSAARISGMMGLVGGLATGFGFLGMDSLARAASGYRRSALGLGTSVGGMRAFELDFGRFVDPHSFLGGVNRSLRDPTQTALRGLGITPQGGEDTADVAVRALEKIQTLAKAQPEAMLGTLLQSRQLSQFGLSLEDLVRLRRMSHQELRDQGTAFRGDVRGLGLSDPQLQGWQNFLTQMQRAGRMIETTFIVRLSPLAPSLAKLSQSITKVLDAFLTKDRLGEWIDTVAKALDHFATYIGTPEFESDVEAFVKNVGSMARVLYEGAKKIAGFLGINTDGSSTSAPPSAPDPAHAPAVAGWGFDPSTFRWRWHNPNGSWSDKPGNQPGNVGPGDRPTDIPKDTWHLFSSPTQDERVGEARSYLQKQGFSETEIDGILSYIHGESRFNPTALNPAGGGQGARGIGQWRGPRLDRFSNMFGHDMLQGSFGEQIAYMAWELKHTEKTAGEHLAQAPNAGAAAEVMWRDFGRGPLSPEAQQARRVWADHYARQAGQHVSMRTPATHVTVTIRNETGGNAVIASSQLA